MAPVSSPFRRDFAGALPARARAASSAALIALALELTAGCGGAPTAATAALAPTSLSATREPDGVRLLYEGRELLFYRTRPVSSAEPWRLHYLHPVRALDGRVLTEDAPADHLHQRGIWWAWRRILLDGQPIADGWVGRDLDLRIEDLRVETLADEALRLQVRVVWRAGPSATAQDLIEETTRIEVRAPSRDRLQLAFDIGLRALRDGVALAGTDDDKGYGGFSVRLVESPLLEFTSGGRDLVAQIAAIPTADAVEMRWPPTASAAGLRVSLQCSVDGQPWRSWVLRRESSMQNCAFPGRIPVSLRSDRPLRLQAAMLVETTIAETGSCGR